MRRTPGEHRDHEHDDADQAADHQDKLSAAAALVDGSPS
jgi:hypothetical protein